MHRGAWKADPRVLHTSCWVRHWSREGQGQFVYTFEHVDSQESIRSSLRCKRWQDEGVRRALHFTRFVQFVQLVVLLISLKTWSQSVSATASIRFKGHNSFFGTVLEFHVLCWIVNSEAYYWPSPFSSCSSSLVEVANLDNIQGYCLLGHCKRHLWSQISQSS